MTEKESPVVDESPVANVQAAPAPKQFVVTEQAVNQLLTAISNLRWADANPLIEFIKNNFKPLPTA